MVAGVLWHHFQTMKLWFRAHATSSKWCEQIVLDNSLIPLRERCGLLALSYGIPAPWTLPLGPPSLQQLHDDP